MKLITDNAKDINELFSSNSLLISHLWHKVFKHNLFEYLDFSFLEKITFSEDLFISLYCFQKASSIEIIHDSYYFYKYNNNSLTRVRSEKSILDCISVSRKLILLSDFFTNRAIIRYIVNDAFHAFGLLIFPNLKNPYQRKAHFSSWREIDDELRITIPDNLSSFVKLYIKTIRKKQTLISFAMWQILNIKEIVNNIRSKR